MSESVASKGSRPRGPPRGPAWVSDDQVKPQATRETIGLQLAGLTLAMHNNRRRPNPAFPAVKLHARYLKACSRGGKVYCLEQDKSCTLPRPEEHIHYELMPRRLKVSGLKHKKHTAYRREVLAPIFPSAVSASGSTSIDSASARMETICAAGSRRVSHFLCFVVGGRGEVRIGHAEGTNAAGEEKTKTSGKQEKRAHLADQPRMRELCAASLAMNDFGLA